MSISNQTKLNVILELNLQDQLTNEDINVANNLWSTLKGKIGEGVDSFLEQVLEEINNKATI